MKRSISNFLDVKLINDSEWEEYQELKEENKQLKKLIEENITLVEDDAGNYEELNINPLKMQQEIEKLKTSNEHLARSIKDYEELLLKKNNIIDEITQFVENYEWYYIELKETILNILKGESEDE